MSSEASDELAVRARGLGKCYHVYRRPQDRLRQFFARRGKRHYREFWANRDLTFEVPRGTTLGIVGRNGAGKTTLLQQIAGTLQPTEGLLEVNGRVTALLELGSGFNRDFTGRENVFLYGAVLGLTRRDVEQRFDRIAAFADIGDFIDQPVKTYSKGMFVRLAFAVLANLDPEIFIVDEALAVGDAYFRHRCMRRFHEMKESGTTVLYVSHDAGSMKRLCDHVLWLRDGRLVEEGEPTGVVDRYLASLFEIPRATENGPRQGSEADGDAPPEQVKGGLAQEARGATANVEETGIPGCDGRLGDGRLRLLGVGLYDPHGAQVGSVPHGQAVQLRLTLRNVDLPEAAEGLVVGYILRNPKGEDLASTNNYTEAQPLPVPAPGEHLTLRVQLLLPEVHGGQYSLTPALGYLREDGGVAVADRVENALVFEVVAERRVHSQLRLDTSFEVEQRGEPPPSADPAANST